ncbi:MAG: acetylglutamate kinase [Syntrophomonadaceae bacterium]|nr:acetylglutamate kinase [Syntrophomonadaceae bacterium]
MNTLRKLWEQHDVWTRSTIVSITFDLPDRQVVIARLLRNPKDFGRVFEKFYGPRIATAFTNLLTEHLVLAAQIVEAAKAGNNSRVALLQRKWLQNANQIAELLSDINNQSEREWRNMMQEHLRLVYNEAVNYLTGNYAAGVAVYDEIEKQTLEMADMMARGIFKQFPKRFKK